jgi:hypothetical protein
LPGILGAELLAKLRTRTMEPRFYKCRERFVVPCGGSAKHERIRFVLRDPDPSTLLGHAFLIARAESWVTGQVDMPIMR